MRKVADLPAGGEYVRAMIYESPDGVYAFLYNTRDDGACVADEWYETLADAESACQERFGIGTAEWTIIDDPQPGCQHDWMRPTRIKLDAQGHKLWGQFESA